MVSLAVPTACSSSSSGTGPSNADGGGAGVVVSPLSDSGGTGLNATCGQLAALLGGSPPVCPSGQTCCTTASIITVSASSMCVAKGQCTGGASNECSTGADCSGGQLCCAGAAATDASAEAGSAVAALDTACQASCEPGQHQVCTSDAECPSGQTCQASQAGTGGLASFVDGGGSMVCAAWQPDGGATGAEGGASPDAHAPVDAGDAAADQ